MTLRHAVLGLAVMFGVSVWACCRPAHTQAQAQPADPVYRTDGDAGCGGTHDEAAYRFRTNQATHWRHVALGR